MDQGIAEEIWKDIPGYEGFYQASTLGRIKSMPRWVLNKGFKRFLKGKILNPSGFKITQEYPGVILHRDGKRDGRPVAHLVLLTFVGPRPLGMECRHFPDRDIKNSCLSNLSWGTRQQNAQDKATHGTKRFGENTATVLKERDVVLIRQIYATEKISQTKLGKRFGCGGAAVYGIVNGKTWKHLLKPGEPAKCRIKE